MSKFSLIPRPLVRETAWYLQLTYTNSLNSGKLLGRLFIVFVFLFLMNDLSMIKARVPYMYFFDQTSRLLFISLHVLCGYYSRAATTMYLRAALFLCKALRCQRRPNKVRSETVTVLDTVSSTRSLSVLLSAVGTTRTTQIVLALAW